jgi:hypothetical protein
MSRLATAVEVAATLALVAWMGGLVALGAFAAPEVFGQLPRDTAGAVMGEIFRRFDTVVLGAAALLAGCEVVRLVGDRPRDRLARVRLAAAAIAVAAAIVSSAWLSPRIHAAFKAGARRGVGAAGAVLDRDHRLAEAAGKAAVAAGASWLALGVIARRKRT